MSKDKLIPEIRFPEFLNKEDWKVKTIDELCDILNNIRKPISSGDRKKGSYPYYGASGIIDYVDDFLFDERLLLIGEDGAKWGAYENTAFLVEGRFWVNNHAHVLKPKLINDKLLESYLVKLDLHPYITGAAPPKLTLGKLKEIPVPVPENEIEQQKIASCLSSLDEVIAAHSQKLELLKDHKKGLMQNLFPQEGEKVPKLRFKEFEKEGEWVEKKLHYFLDLLTDFEANGSFADVKENVRVFDEPNYAWYVRATDLENKSDLESVKYVDEHSYNFLNKTKLFGGELLITKRGEIGKVYIYKPFKNLPATVAPNMYLLKLNEKADASFFFYHFTNAIGNQSLKKLNASSTIGALYKDDVKNITLFAPQLKEQQKIASCLSSLDALITAQAEKIEQLKLHKKGLMQGLFPKIND